MLDDRKRRLSERVKQAELRRSGGTPERASFHRDSYHRNFEGYTEVKRIDERGKAVIQRVYTGNYYEPELDSFHRLTLRLFFLLFFFGGTALFLYCATRGVACNAVLYVNAFQALAIPLLLWCAYVLIFYIPSIGKLTVGEYNTQHKSLIRAARLAAWCMWAAAAAVIVCVVLHAGVDMFANLLCAAGFAGSGLLLFLISFFERSLNYTVTKSSAIAPDDGVEIE